MFPEQLHKRNKKKTGKTIQKRFPGATEADE
jgi:hypothetical protein